jgi:hypothetical protein
MPGITVFGKPHKLLWPELQLAGVVHESLWVAFGPASQRTRNGCAQQRRLALAQGLYCARIQARVDSEDRGGSPARRCGQLSRLL